MVGAVVRVRPLRVRCNSASTLACRTTPRSFGVRGGAHHREAVKGNQPGLKLRDGVCYAVSGGAGTNPPLILRSAAHRRRYPGGAQRSRPEGSPVHLSVRSGRPDLAETVDRQIMRDATEIRRTVAECHGAQRRLLGWSEAEIRREYENPSGGGCQRHPNAACAPGIRTICRKRRMRSTSSSRPSA